METKEKTIKTIFKLTSNYILPIELQLSNWIVPLNERQMKHQWYFSVESNEIYHRDHQSIERYFFQSTNNKKYEANEDSKERCESIPNDAIPITHISHQTFQISRGLHSNITPQGNQMNSSNISNYYHFRSNYC